MVVVSCSYNNAPWAEKSLDSIFMQKYDNFRVIYVDDASEDGTADIVERYIERHNLRDRITLIKNNHRQRKMHNIYNVYHTCEDHEIIVQLDGDDWFAHDQVLADLNQEYLNNDIWLTYGSHENVPYDMGGKSRDVPLEIIEKRRFRETYYYMPPRTFYAWLFKLIKLEDVIGTNVKGFEGDFFPVSNDWTIMWAMLEMAHYRFKYLENISYIANRGNPLVGIKVDKELHGYVHSELKRKIPLYSVVSLPKLNRLTPFEQVKADCVIFSHTYGSDACLSKLVLSIKKNVKNIGKIIVLYSKGISIKKFQKFKKKHSDITFVKMGPSAIVNTLKMLLNNHILFVNGSCVIVEPFDCARCIYEVERTFAYGFYMNVSSELCRTNGIPCQHIIGDMYAWKFDCDSKNKLGIHNFDMTLYRKKDILKLLKKKKMKALSKSKDIWKNSYVDSKKVGLFYKENIIKKVIY